VFPVPLFASSFFFGRAFALNLATFVDPALARVMFSCLSLALLFTADVLADRDELGF